MLDPMHVFYLSSDQGQNANSSEMYSAEQHARARAHTRLADRWQQANWLPLFRSTDYAFISCHMFS